MKIATKVVATIHKVTIIIDKLLSRVTGREHQYFVSLGYRPKGHTGPQQYTINHTFSVRCRSGASFYREIRKHFAPDFIKQLPKHHLSNGEITIERISYLGRY